jgi:catechol 2,3-dioxygenase-like lactoylglutathione lyase family enzyme
MKVRHQSISLAVKDIKSSKEFYENLGYVAVEGAGSVQEKWLIMDNGHLKIGLFQDMFEHNLITINPDDARSFYNEIKSKNIPFIMESPSINKPIGPCYFMIQDPDGNRIFFDQHD